MKRHEQSPSLLLRVRSKSLDHFEPFSFETEGNCATSSSRGVECTSSHSSPVGTLPSAPPEFSHFDQPENSGNDAAVAHLQFNESCKVEDVENVRRNLVVLVDGVESSKDSKRLRLDKSSAKQPSLKTFSRVGTRSELESKVVPTDDVSEVS